MRHGHFQCKVLCHPSHLKSRPVGQPDQVEGLFPNRIRRGRGTYSIQVDRQMELYCPLSTHQEGIVDRISSDVFIQTVFDRV